MVDGAEFSGRTVEDAIASAESELGAGRDELSIEVLSVGSRGVFGFGAESARIRAQRRAASQAAAPAEARSQTATMERPETEPAPGAEALDGQDLPGEAAEVLRRLLTSMGFDVEVTVRSVENPVMLAITGDNLGVLIGRRGDNLAALQFMVNLILSKHRRQWPRIVIDVENYRARREESLQTLADRIAYRVRRNQRPFTLEAMPAGDRRVIHLSLKDRPDIETYSIGEGPARRVVIAPRRGREAATRYGPGR
ncbi:MAG TPA: RNA-binding cell elongation regulator Jag/EloR [Chloroflexota bacterium]|nr:RNA-binding cell elongation regulator Jag/EloR [Chloroflexota bacterium]